MEIEDETYYKPVKMVIIDETYYKQDRIYKNIHYEYIWWEYGNPDKWKIDNIYFSTEENIKKYIDRSIRKKKLERLKII